MSALIPLAKATSVAHRIVTAWTESGFVRRIEIAGSIRRERPRVHDIDLVIIPRVARLSDFCSATAPFRRKGGLQFWTLRIEGIQVDVYFASESTWATLFLIRTGSKEHNISLCQRARQLGLKLHASGAGLKRLEPTDSERWLECSSEEEIFAHLNLPYREPREREI